MDETVTSECEKFGVALIYLVAAEQINRGIDPSVENVRRELDQYYLAFQESAVDHGLKSGMENGFSTLRLMGTSEMTGSRLATAFEQLLQ